MARKRPSAPKAEPKTEVKAEAPGPASPAQKSDAGSEADKAETGVRKSSRARVPKFSVLQAQGKKADKAEKAEKVGIPAECAPPPGKDKPFKCNKCPLICASQGDFARHFAGHGAAKALACPDCDFSTDLPNAMDQHSRLHRIASKSPQSPAALKAPKTSKLPSSKAAPKPPAGPPPAKAARMSAGGSPTAQPTPSPKPSPATNKAAAAPAKTTPKPSQKAAKPKAAPKVLTPSGGGKESATKTAPKAKEPEKEESGEKEQLLECKHCPMTSTKQAHMRAHVAGHKRATGYKCPHCSFRSEFYGILTKHTKLHPEASASADPAKPSGAGAKGPSAGPVPPSGSSREIIQCSHCSFGSDSMGTLRKHLRLHGVRRRRGSPLKSSKTQSARAAQGLQKVPSARLPCPYCDFCARNQRSSKAHLSLHAPATVAKASPRRRCLKCRFGLPVGQPRSLLTQHSLLHHKAKVGRAVSRRLRVAPRPERQAQRSCLECGLVLGSRAMLLVHWARLHKATVLRRRKAYRHSVWRDRRRMDAAGRFFRGPQSSEPLPKLPKEKKEKKLGCAECPYRCAQRAELVKHRTHHLVQSSHQCDRCSFSSGSSQSLSHHVRMHMRAEMADNADFRTTRPSGQPQAASPLLLAKPPSQSSTPQVSPSLPKNQATAGLPDSAGPKDGGMMQCPECPYRCRLSREFKRHAAAHEPNRTSKFRCGRCSFAVNRAAVLAKHFVLHVPDKARSAPFQRDFNPSALSMDVEVGVKDSKGRLLAVLQADSRLLCSFPGCGFTTESGDALLAHAKVHSQPAAPAAPPPMESSLTEEAVANLVASSEGLALAKESRSEPEAKPDPGLECDMCPHLAPNQTMLMIHRKLHNGSRPFRCPCCSYNVHHADSLRQHLGLHSEGGQPLAVLGPSLALGGAERLSTERPGQERRWRCPHCSFRSASADHIVAHQTGHLQELRLRRKAGPKGWALPRSARGLPTAAAALSRPKLSNISAPSIPGRLRQMEAQRYLLYYCPYCSFQSEFPGNMWKHLGMHGAREGARMCSFCSYSARIPEVLLFHEQNHHSHIPFSALRQRGQDEGQPLGPSDVPGPSDAAETPLQLLQCSLCTFHGPSRDALDAHWEDKHNDPHDDSILAALGLTPRTPPHEPMETS